VLEEAQQVNEDVKHAMETSEEGHRKYMFLVAMCSRMASSPVNYNSIQGQFRLPPYNIYTAVLPRTRRVFES